jgi:hypothetical protein
MTSMRIAFRRHCAPVGGAPPCSGGAGGTRRLGSRACTPARAPSGYTEGARGRARTSAAGGGLVFAQPRAAVRPDRTDEVGTRPSVPLPACASPAAAQAGAGRRLLRMLVMPPLTGAFAQLTARHVRACRCDTPYASPGLASRRCRRRGVPSYPPSTGARRRRFAVSGP